MASLLDKNVKLSIPCQGCGKAIEETIARLEQNPTLVCPSCGTSIKIKADDLKRAMANVERELRDFGKQVSKKITIKI
jgi:rRNA maturation endonuclease Nob1